MHALTCNINSTQRSTDVTRELRVLPVLLSISVAKNQIDLYVALAGALSPKVKPNELIGVRVVESEGPLKGQLELKFEHDLPYGTNTFTHTCMHCPMHRHGHTYPNL